MKKSDFELNELLKQAKEKYPIGTYLRHISNPWLKIKDVDLFKIVNKNICYGNYAIYFDNEWCPIVNKPEKIVYIEKNVDLKLIEIVQKYESFFKVRFEINNFVLFSNLMAKREAMKIFDLTEEQFYNLIIPEE